MRQEVHEDEGLGRSGGEDTGEKPKPSGSQQITESKPSRVVKHSSLGRFMHGVSTRRTRQRGTERGDIGIIKASDQLDLNVMPQAGVV